MSFTSLSFIPLIVVVMVLYWVVLPKKASFQNILILLSSLAFVAISDWKAALLIALSGALNFVLVSRMHKLDEGNAKKWFFYFGCIFNVALLSYFKYLHDLVAGIQSLFNADTFHLGKIYLPLGISFFTFQLIGYWIDVYNEETEPEKDLFVFFTYLFYFPKFVSGPIERLQDFTPQLKSARQFNIPQLTDGMRQFLWGFFKKTVVSAHCLLFYKSLYASPDSISGTNMLLAAVMNTIYVYADFSGYSDMACGISKGLGIRITNNFAFPFFATNISEFWKRWHISLTTWIMTYVYTPIAFILRRQKKMGTFIAIFSAFIIVGIWHGLKSGFLVYGCLQALFFLPLVLKGGNMNTSSGSNSSAVATFFRMLALFLLVCITALFVREIPAAQSLKEITLLLTRATQTPDLSGVLGLTNTICWVLIASCFAVEWINRKQDHGLNIQRLTAPVRWSFYLSILLAIFFFSEFPGGGFIYAQF